MPPPPPKDPENDHSFGCGIGPEAEYKGGTAAWLKFLSTTLSYPEDAVTCDVEGTVRVKFVIEKDGTVSNVEALGGPEMLQQEAIHAITMSSGNWLPETMFGHAVKSYKIQPIIFRLAVD
jgi:protein TonB